MKFYQHCFVSPTSATTVLFPQLKSLYIFRDEPTRALQLAIRLVGLMKFLWLLHQRQQPLQHDPSPHLCLSSPSQVRSSAATNPNISISERYYHQWHFTTTRLLPIPLLQYSDAIPKTPTLIPKLTNSFLNAEKTCFVPL